VTSPSTFEHSVTVPDRADFLTHFLSELLRDTQRREFNNTDQLRFPGSSTPKRSIREKIIRLAESRGFCRVATVDQDRLREVLKTEGLEDAYRLFHDQFSRDLFVKLLAYRILGHQHVRLPLNNEQYWKARRSVDQYVEKRGSVTGIPIVGSLDLINFKGIRLQAHALNILNTFLLEQYGCARAGIGVRQGDVVVDAGGCWGDTALYFAQSASKVFCFECIPSNAKIIDENLGMNSGLSGKVKVIRKALWNRPQERLVFKETGPASRPSSDQGGIDVETETLDHFVSESSLDRVDFIKMDIEGSEPEALIGAEQTIRKHRPQLAISIYHDVNHFASIPKWIANLDLGYRLYLDHFTIHAEETVLFARTDSHSGR
jgi:FkbM family methyltransferase